MRIVDTMSYAIISVARDFCWTFQRTCDVLRNACDNNEHTFTVPLKVHHKLHERHFTIIITSRVFELRNPDLSYTLFYSPFSLLVAPFN